MHILTPTFTFVIEDKTRERQGGWESPTTFSYKKALAGCSGAHLLPSIREIKAREFTELHSNLVKEEKKK